MALLTSWHCVDWQYVLNHFPAQDRYSLPTERNPITVHTHAHHSTARRSLIANQSILPQLATPIRGEATMRRAGDRIFIHAHPWGEEPRDEIRDAPQRSAQALPALPKAARQRQ